MPHSAVLIVFEIINSWLLVGIQDRIAGLMETEREQQI